MQLWFLLHNLHTFIIYLLSLTLYFCSKCETETTSVQTFDVSKVSDTNQQGK